MGRPAVDISGQRFGRLVALRDVGSFGTGRIWEFKCDCGNLLRHKAATIRHGKTQSCGCLANELTSQRKRLNLLGKTFGRLTVESCAGPDKHGKVCWRCVCSCGNGSTVTGSQLTTGKTRSCGCLQKEAARQARLLEKQEMPVSRTKAYRSALRKRLRQRPSRAMAERLSRLLSFALKGVSALKDSPTFEMVGYTPDELRLHIERQFTKGMTWENRGEWQLDHIIPISTAQTKEDVIALNQLSNLRPLWAADNLKKRANRVTLL